MALEDPRAKTSVPLPTTAIAALHRGDKIEAIKIVREEHGLELKSAKELVDEYVATHPTLQTSLNTRAATTQGAWYWLVAIAAVLALLYFVLRTNT
jgi:ribosomal protein L7/L12